MEDHYLQKLNERRQKGLYRSLQIIPGGSVDFSSNDYLGYARLIAAEVIPTPPATGGSTGSRLICGNHIQHEQAEKSIAEIFKVEAALLYSSGYMANIGLISCMASRSDIILHDAYIHASMRDGIRLAGAPHYSFAHNDLAALESLIQKYADKRIIVLMESLYSMTGTSPDMAALAALQQRYTFELVLDEAHAAGVCGTESTGYGGKLQPEGLSRIITFGKAFGYQGAAVLSSRVMRDYQINFSRPFIYHTGMTPADAGMISNIIAYHQQNKAPQIALQQNISHFLKGSKKSKMTVSQNQGPVQYIYLRNNKAALEAEKKLAAENFTVKAIRYPTVPLSHAGLRISLHSYNTQTEIENLISLLG